MLGPMVFRLQLPLELAPSMNVYSHLKHWERGKLATRVDEQIMLAIGRYPDWRAGFTDDARIVKGKIRMIRHGGRRRHVVVIRESSRELDELSCDVAGGKIPIDRLARAGVLVGDSKKWIDREARWLPAHPNQGRVVLEVYDLRPE